MWLRIAWSSGTGAGARRAAASPSPPRAIRRPPHLRLGHRRSSVDAEAPKRRPCARPSERPVADQELGARREDLPLPGRRRTKPAALLGEVAPGARDHDGVGGALYVTTHALEGASAGR